MVAIAYGDRRTPIYPRCVPPRYGAGVPASMILDGANLSRPDGVGGTRGALEVHHRACGTSKEGSWLR